MAIYARLENGTYAEVTGVYKTDGTEVTEIFRGDRLVYSASSEIYGSLPLYYNGKGYDLTDYLISGNTVQDGTPSAQAPVDATGCGVRTGNLWDGGVPEYVYAKDYKKYNPDNAIMLQAGTYTISSNGKLPTIQAFDASHTQLEIAGAVSYAAPYYRVWDGFAIGPMTGTARTATITLLSDCILTFTITDNFGSYIMLNLGSTALPYEPYGYKLPLTVNGVEYPIYLGTVPTTRRVKKLVLTGEETSWNTSGGFMYNDTIQPDYLRSTATTLICSHYKAIGGVGEGARVSNGQCAFYRFTSIQRLYIRDNNYTSVADFKSYLAAQYAAGTPVTVWYVLAEPETGVVNEPLMKIGDYADTVSAAQAGVTIPTIDGENVLDMASPVKPSEVYIKGKGIKPTGYGKLTDVNGVNILDKDGRPIYVHGQ